MRTLVLAAAASVLLSPCAMAQPGTVIVAGATFVEQPTQNEVASARTLLPSSAEVTFVPVRCSAAPDGHMQDCKQSYGVSSEYGPAALKLAPRYRIDPQTVSSFAGKVLLVEVYLGRAWPPPKAPWSMLPVEKRNPQAADTPPRSPVIMKPEWLRLPSGGAVAKAYPKAALAAGQSGRVTMSCTVLADGLIGGCKVVSENPAGMGFGEAALSLAPQFRMRATTADGGSVVGAAVRIPMSFSPPR